MNWLQLVLAGLLEAGWALRTLPLGTAYAVWVGIGVVGTGFGVVGLKLSVP